MATLESLEVMLQNVAADVRDVKDCVERQNGRVRETERAIAVLQEQQTTRTGALVALQVLIGAVATWLGVSR